MKPYTCPCGTMAVWESAPGTLAIRGGWLKGQPYTHSVCMNKKCGAQKRIGYNIELMDKNNEKYYPKRGATNGKATTRSKARTKNKVKSGNELWQFVDS